MRKESMSREVLRHPEFEGCVTLARKRDHFICTSYLTIPMIASHIVSLLLTHPPTLSGRFGLGCVVNIESEGAYAPEALFLESIKVMREKISVLKRAVEDFSNSSGDGDIQMEDA